MRFTRDVGGIVMDLDDLEEIDTVAGGGADTFAVGDLEPHRRRSSSTSASPRLRFPAGDGAGRIA